MPDVQDKSQGTQPPPQSGTGHPLPRRSTAENSVTLQHHQATREASLRASAGSVPPGETDATSSPQRNSSGDSHNTSSSDANKWFDHSNKNPTATFESHAMDVDPPFFQRESDSSNGDKSYMPPLHLSAPQFSGPQSSSAEEYRSVIDDLTVEIQRLKDELRRYKQKGPDTLSKDKLFEIKVHGLPKSKKRELESTLRDFAASLEGSPNASSSKQGKNSKYASRNHMYSASGSMSKHASSSSGSNHRPADSAYASMSTGANSSGTSLARPSMSSRAKSSEQKVESYLRDIPEGLYPRHVLMTDKERKKMAVKRLEQLFTGKISGRRFRRHHSNGAPAVGNNALPPVSSTEQNRTIVHQPPALGANGLAREARILSSEQQLASGKKTRSRDNVSASNSNEQHVESGANGAETNTSPTTAPPPPDQRPTRLTDLDPYRKQVPSENMEYIKHLGLVPPELLNEPTEDVHPDAEGWVYLNLLCSLAQLHIINVTPDFVRQAVSEKSTKFQLSPDGRKIRWRGGTEGTKFSSDSSGENSGNSMELDTDNMEMPNKRQKTGNSTGTGDEFQSGSSSKRMSNSGFQNTSSASFHYQPIFVHQNSSNGQLSMDDTLSSTGPVEDSNVDDSRWGQSGSGMSGRRKRRQDGAIIYYSGAPFCTDLSGDPGDVSPTYMLSGHQESNQPGRPFAQRSESGSSLPYRPLSDPRSKFPQATDMDADDVMPGLTTDTSDDNSEIGLDLEWGEQQQFLEVHTLEACGLGGVLPDDHFMVVVTTKRPKAEFSPSTTTSSKGQTDDEVTGGIIGRLASMSTSSPGRLSSQPPVASGTAVEIEYVSGRIKRLTPVRLPPPAIFFPPFSSDSSAEYDGPVSFSFDDESPPSEGLASRKANVHRSDDYPDGVDLTSGDEDGEDPDNEPDSRGMYDVNVRGSKRSGHPSRSSSGARQSQGSAGQGSRLTGGSSAATANSSIGEMSL